MTQSILIGVASVALCCLTLYLIQRDKKKEQMEQWLRSLCEPFVQSSLNMVSPVYYEVLCRGDTLLVWKRGDKSDGLGNNSVIEFRVDLKKKTYTYTDGSFKLNLHSDTLPSRLGILFHGRAVRWAA